VARYLDGVLPVALVLDKLEAKTFLRICNPLHRSHGDLELAIANSARANCGNCPKPFEHSKSALFHVFDGAASRFHFKEGQRVALIGRHDQKTLKLLSPKIFGSCVRKIAVGKFTI
jgi:hypothetical protein